MIVGYINSNKKNVDAASQRQAISDYAQANGLIIDTFYTSDNVSQLAECLQTGGHDVLFANIVSVGGTLLQVKDNLRFLLAKSLKIVSIKENMILESGKDAEMLLQGLEQAAEIMSSMISVSSKRALADKKEQGYKLGRKTGYRNQKYIWSGKEEEIKQKLLAGMTRRQVAQDTGMSIFSLY
ncbi:MAG: recombinase family protein, partial [Alphaproteobacteria bacterium]|nr:recombinase family protein [Alphaproteobacteria bacterium]